MCVILEFSPPSNPKSKDVCIQWIHYDTCRFGSIHQSSIRPYHPPRLSISPVVLLTHVVTRSHYQSHPTVLFHLAWRHMHCVGSQETGAKNEDRVSVCLYYISVAVHSYLSVHAYFLIHSILHILTRVWRVSGTLSWVVSSLNILMVWILSESPSPNLQSVFSTIRRHSNIEHSNSKFPTQFSKKSINPGSIVFFPSNLSLPHNESLSKSHLWQSYMDRKDDASPLLY